MEHQTVGEMPSLSAMTMLIWIIASIYYVPYGLQEFYRHFCSLTVTLRRRYFYLYLSFEEMEAQAFAVRMI